MTKKKRRDEIKLANIESEIADVEAPLQPYEILSYPADFTLEVLVEKWNQTEIKAPRLQRKYLWTIERASKLIESFLLGLPVPPIFVYKDEDEKLLIVDGHQRLRSIVYFFSGWFGEPDDQDREPFKLTGLHERSPFIGADRDHLEKTDQKSFNRLKNSVLRAFIMKQLHPKDDTSILEIFGRLNTGGVTLQGQEIRNCIYEGEFNERLKEMNKNLDWRKIVGTTSQDKRMRDIELILRFLALFNNLERYGKPMKLFLDKFMAANRRPPADQPEASDAIRRAIAAKQKEFADKMSKFDALFIKTAHAVVTYLGSKPFHRERGLNAAVFDSVFTAFARNLDKVESNPSAAQIKEMKRKFDDLLAEDDYDLLISSATTDKDVVPSRLQQAEKFLF